MTLLKGFTYRIYPTAKQEHLLKETFGCKRYVYNYLLKAKMDAYESGRTNLGRKELSKLLTGLKHDGEHLWLKNPDKFALQNAIADLLDSFARFYVKQNKFPKFKSKRSRQSYRTSYTNGNIAILPYGKNSGYIKLPKLGKVKYRDSRPVPQGKIINATVSREPSGIYMVSILMDVKRLPQAPKTNLSTGIDLGLEHFAILSDGTKISNPRALKKMQTTLAREQQKLSRRALLAKQASRKLDECKNYQRQKLKVARLHKKIANQRRDFLHKLTTKLITQYDNLVIEDLNIKGMMKNHKLAKSIADVSWFEFVRQLDYKAKWYGRTIIKIDRWYSSSQICSNCGAKTGKKDLSIRAWDCQECGSHHDRDVNAAINILNKGLGLT